MRKESFFFLLALIMTNVQAEEKIALKVGVEAGCDWHGGSSYTSFDRIRKGSSSYSYENGIDDVPFVYDSESVFLKHSLNSWYVGLKPEFLFWKRLGVSAGVRLTSYTSTFENEDASFFYWRVCEDGVYSDFVRIHKMEQQSYYVGIPLELRILLGGTDRPCRVYFKLGSVLNFRCKTENEVDFVASPMEYWENDVVSEIESPSDFTSYIYPAVGFRIGRNIPLFNIEFHFPSFMINQASSLLDTGVGLGLQFSFQMPVWTSADKE